MRTFSELLDAHIVLHDAFVLACAERATISGNEEGFYKHFMKLAEEPEMSSTLEKLRRNKSHTLA